MKLLGGDVGAVGDKVSSLGEKSTGLAVLDAKIRTSRSEVKKLADEFVKTGDVDIFRKLGEAEGKLRGLQEVRKKLGSALVDGVEDAAKVLPKALAKSGTQAGSEFSKLFSSSLAGGLSTPVLGPILIAAVAAIAVPLATFVGAAIGGALLLGGGAAGAGLGLAGAWMGDPVKYQSMWNKSIDGIQRRWMDSSSAFGDELEGALKVVDQVLRDLPIEKVLALSQSFVAPLAGGLGSGITAAADGFADFLAKAQPVVDKVGPALANLGHDIGDAFRIISLGSSQGGDALSDLISVIGWTIKAVAVMIGGFELAYGALRDFASEANNTAHSVPVLGGAIDYVNDKLYHIGATGITAGRALDDVTTAASGSSVASKAAAAAANALGNALDEMRGKAFAAADADLALKQGWLDLKKELENGKRTLDTNTQAGLDNAKGILTQIENAERLRQQQIKLGGDTVEAHQAADAAYAESIEKIKQAAYAAHFNKEEVDKLIASLGAVPPVTQADVKVPGLGTALDQGISLGNALNRIDGKTYTARVAVSVPQGISLGNLMHHADGGVVPRSGLSVVGEEGPEIAWLNQGQYISTAQQTRDLMSAGSSYANMRATGDIGRLSGGGAAMPRELVLNATFIDPMDGGTIRKQVIRWSLDRGRDPATAFA